MLREERELKKIGERLKKLRIKKGHTSYESFAIEYGFSRMQYWRLEQGKTNLTLRSLISVLNIHKISIEDFFSKGFEEL